MNCLSVVIPAYNEENAIGPVLERVLNERQRIVTGTDGWISRVEVVVVNDGSRDRTAEVVGRYPGVRLVTLETNHGYGGALKVGFERAEGELIAFLDADGTYPPEELTELCRVMRKDDADMVIGSRMSGADSEMPFTRYVGNTLFAILLTWIVGRRITDTASGMRVFKKETLPRMWPLPDGLHLTPAMSTQALHQGLKVVEVPIKYEERVGRSKLNVMVDGVRFVSVIVRTARLYNPLKFFGLAGGLIIGLGFLLGVNPVAYYVQTRRVEDNEVYRLFTIMVLWITGINVVTFGAFSNYVLEIMHGTKLKRSGLLRRWLLHPRVVRRWGAGGAVLMLSAALLNHRTIYEYLTIGHIYVHWAYILTGATLFLVGLQILMGSILIGILEELKEREQRFSR